MRKQGSCLEKDIIQGTMPGSRRQRRSSMAWVDNIKTWTGLSVEESVRMTEDRDKYVHGVAVDAEIAEVDNAGVDNIGGYCRGALCRNGQ